jgi:FAD/FMN-containing dehydrogenase
MTFTWLFARILGEEIAQARQIRQVTATAMPVHGVLEREVLGRIKSALDPKNILNPGIA